VKSFMKHGKRGLWIACWMTITASAPIVTAQQGTDGYGREVAREGDRFIEYERKGNRIVLDTKTNLIWAAKDNQKDINWKDATAYCKNFAGGGFADWRLPTMQELEGLYDPSKGNLPLSRDGSEAATAADKVHLTKLIHLTGSAVWSSRVIPSIQKVGPGEAVSIFVFTTGIWGVAHETNAFYRALPVRAGK
jgi:Protein of unknown function (DUF1566)